MIPIQLIREHPDVVIQGLQRRHEDTAVLDHALALDTQRRQLMTESEALRARRNEASKQIGRMKERPPQLIDEMRQVGDRIKAVEDQTRDLDQKLNDLLLVIPNLPLDEVPDGADALGNVVVRQWGEPRAFAFEPKAHWELGEQLGVIDFARGQKISGSRFYILRGKGARLQRALIDWMLDLHVQEHGYTEIYPPYIVKRECLVGSGNLPKFGDNLYHDAEDPDVWFVPTAEVPITNLHRDEILEPGSLPISYVAYTACFRREKMSAGKDVRGIKRGHQFDKVEMYKFVEPETSAAALEEMVGHAEDVARRLEIPYRVVKLCAGDLGFQSAMSFDIEMWAAGVQEWLEVSSCSNCLDFQAHRANIRYRPEPKSGVRYPHTLNGSGLALPRVMIAIMENFQQSDGSIQMPKALQPYTRFDRIP